MADNSPLNRLGYKGDIQLALQRACNAFAIGSLKDFSVIGVGYEDCNIVINTEKGKYVTKIFAQTRKTEDIERYSQIMERAVEAGVNHPNLYKTNKGEVVYNDGSETNLSLVLMDYIAGNTFLELDRAPNEIERSAILEQAALINKIDYHPPYLLDSWAIVNIEVMFDRVKQYIQPEDIVLVEKAVDRYKSLPIKDLPHSFVHGDFTKANVLKAEDGKIYILDFSVANWYPRIQELAVITANLLYDKDNSQSLQDKTEIVADEYSKYNLLEVVEQKYLYDYTLAGIAMEFMGSHQEKYIKGNDTEETDYWLGLGREGLRSELLK